MQFSSWKSTMPFVYCTIAPGDGHAFRQPGSSQCMQPSLRISHSRLPFGFSYSEKRITVHECSVRSSGLSYTPWLIPTSSRRSFHSMHAVWHALQPMHLLTSISFATVPVIGSRTAGDCTVVAERRLISNDCSAIASPLGLLDLHQERLEFRCLRIPVAHDRRQRIAQITRFRLPFEAPMQRNADRLHLLAVDHQRLDAFGH